MVICMLKSQTLIFGSKIKFTQSYFIKTWDWFIKKSGVRSYPGKIKFSKHLENFLSVKSIWYFRTSEPASTQVQSKVANMVQNIVLQSEHESSAYASIRVSPFELILVFFDQNITKPQNLIWTACCTAIAQPYNQLPQHSKLLLI